MTKLQLRNLHQTVVKTFLSTNISKSNNQNEVLTWHLHTPGSHQSSLLNSSEFNRESISELETREANNRTRVNSIKNSHLQKMLVICFLIYFSQMTSLNLFSPRLSYPLSSASSDILSTMINIQQLFVRHSLQSGTCEQACGHLMTKFED